MTMPFDLFENPVVPGLSLQPDIVSLAASAELIGGIDTTTMSPLRFQQWDLRATDLLI